MPLFVVATPIGNLEDMTHRAVRVLGEVDAVVAEDTRRTRGLLTHFNLSKPLLSLPAFDERARVRPLVERLVAGASLALVTDAGTPAISDPGAALVDAAWEAGVTVVPIPGCSAVTATLSASGLEGARFFFAGFLPRKGKARQESVEELARLQSAFVIYEAGNRTGETLGELASRLGARRALVAREVTKLHEELARGTLFELAERFVDGARGEVVIVVEAGRPEEAELEPLEAAIERRLTAGEKLSHLARTLAGTYPQSRQEIYALAQRLREQAPEASETEIDET